MEERSKRTPIKPELLLLNVENKQPKIYPLFSDDTSTSKFSFLNSVETNVGRVIPSITQLEVV